MIGAALSDLHLGFRQFQAMKDGRNVREQDVEAAWRLAVEDVARAQPDLVTIAGDIFHHPRVSDFAKLVFLQGVQRLLEDTRAYVIILQGNHDAGRTAEVLTPISLAKVVDQDRPRADLTGAPRLYVVTEPTRIWLPMGEWLGRAQGRISVACFPFVTRTPEAAPYALEPDPEADVNILLMHAAVKGDGIPWFYGGTRSLDIKREAERWDAIILGDYHEVTRLHPERLAFYSGALERTSSNIWQEKAEKGWVLYDTEAQTMELRKIPTRPMEDKSVSVATADELNAVLREMAAVRDRAGLMVRLVVDNFPREEREHVDWDAVRKMKDQCLHFYLDLRYKGAEVTDMGDRRERGQALSLAAEARSFFAEDLEDVRALALGYLDVEAAVEELEEVEV